MIVRIGKVRTEILPNGNGRIITGPNAGTIVDKSTVQAGFRIAALEHCKRS